MVLRSRPVLNAISLSVKGDKRTSHTRGLVTVLEMEVADQVRSALAYLF
jgi:hypothetical protein